MSVATPEAETQAEAGEQHFVLRGVDWDQYVTINDALPGRRGLRMIYIDGSLTLVTLSRRHDWNAEYFDAIVKAVAVACEIEMDVAGSATLRGVGQKVGVEGDRTYYIGANAELMGGPIDIDLSVQPPPDLAVEVELTHPAELAVEVYARLGVPEVWRYDIRRQSLTFLVLGPEGSYQTSARSRAFPMLSVGDVLEQVRLGEASRSFTRWSIQLNEWARATILPRMAEG